MVNVLVAVGFGLFYALWRRCYGGLDSKIWKKIFPKHGSAMHRWFWRIVNLAAVFCLMFFYTGMTWYWATYTALVMQFVFWDWTFGMYMSIGRHEMPPPPEDIDEYDEQLFAPLLNWLVEGENRYGEFYDYMGMLFRFSAPGLLLCFVPGLNLGMCFAGTLIATSYLTEARFREKGYDNFLTNNFSELAAGFFAGFLLVMV